MRYVAAGLVLVGVLGCSFAHGEEGGSAGRAEAAASRAEAAAALAEAAAARIEAVSVRLEKLIEAYERRESERRRAGKRR